MLDFIINKLFVKVKTPTKNEGEKKNAKISAELKPVIAVGNSLERYFNKIPSLYEMSKIRKDVSFLYNRQEFVKFHDSYR